MENSRRILLSGVSATLHALVVPLFSFVFTILYKPFDIPTVLEMESGSYTFNITILLCIVLGSMMLTRGALYLMRERLPAGDFYYALWCLGETVVAALFASLYITLMLNGTRGYFEIVGVTVGQLFGIAIYPYAILYLGLKLYAERNKEEVDPSKLIKFYDEYRKLRFVIASEAVVFLKSEENYVQIHYVENSKTKKFVLRSSMRALEESMGLHGLVRCHRSYYINPDHVKMIRKEPSGVVVALLKEENYEPIPISRKYQEEMMRVL